MSHAPAAFPDSGRSSVPFFPFGIEPAGEGGPWGIRHPLLGTLYEVNDDARELLDLCDGVRTWEEVLRELRRRRRIAVGEIERRCRRVLAPLERDGLLWRRNERARRVPIGPPKFVLWNLTNRCNHRCRHCVVDAGRRLARELETAEALDLVRQLAEHGVESLVLSGGEPLLRPDFLEIAREARGRGLTFQVATNATRVTPRLAAELAAMGASAQVSLDGSTPAVHDAFRRSPGAWSRTVRGVKELKRAGIPVMLAATVTRLNCDDVPALYRLGGDLGADTFRILPFVPCGRGAGAKALELPPSRMRGITRWLRGQGKDGAPRVAPMEFECTFSPPPGVPPAEAARQRIGCDGAVAYCTITATGDVLPCNFFSGVRVHGVRSRPFAWIWDNCRFLNYFRSLRAGDIRGVCGGCEWLGSCRGSCIAANFVHGDVFQSNCHCWHARELERKQRAEELE